MARTAGEHPPIPLKLLAIYVRGVAALLEELPLAARGSLNHQHVESRTRFLEELIDELKEGHPDERS